VIAFWRYWAHTAIDKITSHLLNHIWKNKKQMLGPFATASRFTPIHQVSLAVLSRAACTSMSNDNDNAWQRGPLWPHGMGPINRAKQHYARKYKHVKNLLWYYETYVKQMICTTSTHYFHLGYCLFPLFRCDTRWIMWRQNLLKQLQTLVKQCGGTEVTWRQLNLYQ